MLDWFSNLGGGSPAHESGPLSGVVACILLDQSESIAVTETIRAFGGQTTHELPDATHVLVPNNISAADLPRFHGLQESCQSTHKPIVRVSWLQEVVGSTSKSPWDAALIAAHVPSTSSEPLVADQSCETAVRRTDPTMVTGSLSETWAFLRREHPEEIEAGQIRMAMERSLLDCAIALHESRGARSPSKAAPPEEVLEVSKGATAEEVKAAYKKKAKANHPDKGGDAREFCRLQQAYLSLVGENTATDSGPQLALPSTMGQAKDFELREHRSLVASWFERHGTDLDQHVAKQLQVLEDLRLEVCDVGSTNHNEQGALMHNQCFYLSLAKSYLRGRDHARAELESTALFFKRVVEAAVLAAHPDWGGERVGEDVQAFSDFLFFVLDSNALMSELAVAIFDSVSGGVEVYRGAQYPAKPSRDAEQRANLLVLKYVPGHYQALVPSAQETSLAGPTLAELQERLDERGILYVVTNA